MTKIFTKRNLNLLYELTISSFKLRNEGSILGLLWYLLNPLLTLIVLYVVFSKNIGGSIPNFTFYVLIGIIQWNFFSFSTHDGMISLERYKDLIKKTNFPRELLVVSSVLTLFIAHLIEWSLLLIILTYFLGLSFNLFLLPLILILQIILSLILSFILAGLFSYYKDVQNIWRTLLFIGWFLTPIFYLKEIIPAPFYFINYINPITHILNFTRIILLEKTMPDLFLLLFIYLIFIFLLAISYKIFKKLVVNVAERL